VLALIANSLWVFLSSARGAKPTKRARVGDTERGGRGEPILMVNPRVLAASVLLAAVCTLVRIIQGLAYAFSSNRQEWSLVTAGFGVRFGMVFLMQLLAALSLIAGGLLSLKGR
jgi:hypothetical protein